MNNFNFTCPVCGQVLYCNNKTLRCASGHSFDLAAAGYVNLLRTQSARTHGDDKIMARARREFLSRGYYRPIADAVSESLVQLAAENKRLGKTFTLLDAGCGEGFYTNAVANTLAESGADIAAAGIDISRDAVALASKAYRAVSFAVASVYELPVADNYCDGIISLFAPFPEKELIRAVKPGGFIVRAVPLADHLWELKRLLYDNPRENDPTPEPEFLMFVSHRHVSYKISVGQPDLNNLFMMTPYFHRTSREDFDKLSKTDALDVTISIEISTYSTKI
jgi:Methylase involved in ubiquinone/menaquinone biosynthesis